MSSDEAAPAVDPTLTADEPAPKPASRTRPSSTVDPKKKIARPSVPGAKKAQSSGGVGASKKASAPAGDKTFNPGDIVLARLKGYPPWPARIANPDEVPVSVKAARPVTGRAPAPGKKSNLYAVEYFPVGDYRDLEHLSPKAITDFLNEPRGRASGDLKKGYEVAADPTEWDADQQEIRQAKEDALNQVDELDDEDEDADASAGKRKKSGKDKSKKKAKTAKSNVEVEEEEEVKPKPKAAKAKAEKAKAQPASKAEPAAPVDDDPLSSDPECVKVKDWRHKLQRAFLGKAPPAADEMPTYDTLFKTIEEYKDITIDALTYSKIGKVMKKIATQTNIARNDEFKITDRASKLMQDWQNVVGGNKTEANGNGNGNGDAAKETETKGEAAPEPEQSAADPAVNGTGEGEGSAEKTEAETKMDVEPTPAE